MPRNSVLDEFRRRFARDGKAMDHGRSMKSAIKGMCFSCVGGESYMSRISGCEIFDCPLWRFRPYGETDRPEGIVPTAEEYDVLYEDSISDARRAANELAAARLREMRENG